MPVIPYKYVVEMICDNLAAGMTYRGKEWKQDYQLNYWIMKREKVTMNPIIKDILTEVFTKVAEEGVEKTIQSSVLRSIYDKHVPTKK